MLVLTQMSKSGPYVVPEWSTATDIEILKALEKHYAGKIDLTKIWSIGDEREVSLFNATNFDGSESTDATMTLVLSEVGGKKLKNNSTDCIFQVDFKTPYPYLLPMNSTDTYNGGWRDSEIRDFLNTNLLPCFNENVQKFFKQFNNTTYIYDSAISTSDLIKVNTLDTFALRCYSDVSEDISSEEIYPAEQTYNPCIEYYKTSINVHKAGYPNQPWRLRSQYYDELNISQSERYPTLINPQSLSIMGQKATTLGIIAPFGVI